MTNEIDVTALHPFYRGLDELVGTAAMLSIYEQYCGMQITFPIHIYDRHLAAKAALAEYDGSNQQLLAHKYGYSQKWMQQVIRRQDS